MRNPSESADRVSEWFSPEKIEANVAHVERFWNGRGRVMVSFTTLEHNYRQQPVERMPELAPLQLKVQSRMPGVNVPSFYPDFGTVSLPRYWGGQLVHPQGGNVYIQPVAGSVDEALTIQPKPVDDPAMDGATAVALYRQVSESLGTDRLWFRTSDMQGPLNIAAMVVRQEELLMAMAGGEQAEQVDRLLGRITDFHLELMAFYRRSVGDQIAGNIWPHTVLPIGRGLSFTEDMMPLLSAETYARFGLPILRRLERQYGGLLIHCCGRWGHHARTLAEAGLNILAVEFHYPFTTIEQLEPLADRAVFIPYLAVDQQTRFSSTMAFYQHLMDHTPHRYRYWFAFGDQSCVDDERWRGWM